MFQLSEPVLQKKKSKSDKKSVHDRLGLPVTSSRKTVYLDYDGEVAEKPDIKVERRVIASDSNKLDFSVTSKKAHVQDSPATKKKRTSEVVVVKEKEHKHKREKRKDATKEEAEGKKRIKITRRGGMVEAVTRNVREEPKSKAKVSDGKKGKLGNHQIYLSMHL